MAVRTHSLGPRHLSDTASSSPADKNEKDVDADVRQCPESRVARENSGSMERTEGRGGRAGGRAGWKRVGRGMHSAIEDDLGVHLMTMMLCLSTCAMHTLFTNKEYRFHIRVF